jgi:hypothetical protein
LEEVDSYIRELYTRLHLPAPKLVFANQRLARMSVLRERIVIRRDLKITATALRALLAHEVQAHYLRSYNQRWQTFPHLKHSQYLRTEEGLATLLDNFYKTKPDFSNVCRQYLGVAQAQTSSFAELFAWRRQFAPHGFNHVWLSCVRLKRGLQDTSQPGGFTKDLVYLEGLIQVLEYLTEPGNDVKDLYLGKIDISQLPAIKAQAVTDNLVYPEFTATASQRERFRLFLQSCKLELGLAQL